MIRELEKSINEFNSKKKSKGKYSVPYGKWNDKWNIHDVLHKAQAYFLINKILNKL